MQLCERFTNSSLSSTLTTGYGTSQTANQNSETTTKGAEAKEAEQINVEMLLPKDGL